MNWSATQYTKFEAERTRPVQDLLAPIPSSAVTRAADIGCGPGNSTELLQACFPNAVITAIDTSTDMIEAARQRLPGIRFTIEDIAAWSDPGPFDLILANAVLQWVPAHESVLPALIAKLAPGGRLAVQIPDNLDEPSHRLMRQLASSVLLARQLAGAAEASAHRHTADWYFRALRPFASHVDIWRTTYYHPLAGGAAAVVEWFKGSGLRPFLDPLDESARSSFLSRYQELIAEAYPSLSDGTVLLPFPRLFLLATR